MKYKVIIMEEGRTEPVLSAETDMVFAVLLKDDVNDTGNVGYVGGSATAKQLVSMSYTSDSLWMRIFNNSLPAKLLRTLMDATGGAEWMEIDMTDLLKAKRGGEDV